MVAHILEIRKSQGFGMWGGECRVLFFNLCVLSKACQETEVIDTLEMY